MSQQPATRRSVRQRIARSTDSGAPLPAGDAVKKAKKGGKGSSASKPDVVWTPGEDAVLTTAAQHFGRRKIDWAQIATRFKNKSVEACKERWESLNKLILRSRVRWNQEEDDKLRAAIEKYRRQHGGRAIAWPEVAQDVPFRDGKQCRERWMKHVDPDMNHGDWNPAEDKQIIQMQREWGNSFIKMAQEMPRRSSDMIGERWHRVLKNRKSRLETPAESPFDMRALMDAIREELWRDTPHGRLLMPLPSIEGIVPLPPVRPASSLDQDPAVFPPSRPLPHAATPIGQEELRALCEETRRNLWQDTAHGRVLLVPLPGL